MEWTNDKVVSLIELYRNRPVLWDCRLKAYKGRNKRHDALMGIAVSFGVREEEVERKLKNLVCHFSRRIKISKSSLVYILRLNAISYVDAVNFQRSQLALCLVGLAN
jgi:hypothetical protein